MAGPDDQNLPPDAPDVPDVPEDLTAPVSDPDVQDVQSDVRAGVDDAQVTPNQGSTAPEPVQAPNGIGLSPKFADKVNQVLKFRLILKADKKTPDFTKRDELKVAFEAMARVGGEPPETSEQVFDKVTMATSHEDMRKLERAVSKGKERVEALDAASDYLGGNFAKNIKSILARIGEDDYDKRTSEIKMKQIELEGLRVELTSEEDKGKKGDIQRRINEVQAELSDFLVQDDKYKAQVEIKKELKVALTELFEHIAVLKTNNLLDVDFENKFNADSSKLESANPANSDVDLEEIFISIMGFLSKDKIEKLVVDVDAKHAELSKTLRADEQRLKFAKDGKNLNRDLTDHQFALKMFEYAIRKQTPGLEPEEVTKRAKKVFLDKLWESRTGKSLEEVTNSASSSLLDIMNEATMKDTLLKFKYKAGGNVVEPFAGIDPADLREDRIDIFLNSGKLDLKAAFFLLSALEKSDDLRNGRLKAEDTYQYGAIRKYVLELLVDEHGLTQAQAIKAYNDKNKKFAELMGKYSVVEKQRGDLSDQVKKLKVKRAETRVKAGELDQIDFLHELEDAGVAKNGKVDRAMLSRLGVSGSYYLNHRYWDKAGNIVANRALWLGEQMLLNPALLAGRWLGSEALSLIGGVAAFGGRTLFSYPLSLLRAPWHILTHPFSALFRPTKTFKAAGASVVEGFKKVGESKVAGKQARRAFVKGQVEKGVAEFSFEAKQRVDVAKIRESGSYQNSMKSLAKQIEKLEKELEESVLKIGSDVDMNFEKYKTVTEKNDKEAA